MQGLWVAMIRHCPPHIDYLTSCRWLLLPGFPLPFYMVQAIKNWRREWPGTRLNSGNVGNTSVNTEDEVRYTEVSWKSTHPLLCPNLMYRVKVYSNEHPTWSKLCVANGLPMWSFRSTTLIAKSLSISEVHKNLHIIYFTEGYYKADSLDGHS